MKRLRAELRAVPAELVALGMILVLLAVELLDSIAHLFPVPR